jgi:hypothetical protein
MTAPLEAGTSNAAPAKKLRHHDGFTTKEVCETYVTWKVLAVPLRTGEPREKLTSRARLRPAIVLFAPGCTLTMAGHWNKTRIQDILAAGGRRYL